MPRRRGRKAEGFRYLTADGGTTVLTREGALVRTAGGEGARGGSHATQIRADAASASGPDRRLAFNTTDSARRPVRSSTANRLIVTAAVIAALAGAVAGWGYWRALSHADLHILLYDVALKTERQAYGPVLAADLVFRNAEERSLASGRADKPWGIISMLHPEVGDCRREEREGGTAWSRCFDIQSRWLMTWVRQVHHATVAIDRCTIATVPVVLEESRDAWWLWWVPHPHLDNSTRTHFTMTLWIDSANCIPAVVR
jgi:hypothetical protein